MADFSPAPHSGDGTDAGRPGPTPGTGRPRWVLVFTVVAVALVLAFVITHVAAWWYGGHR